MAPTETNPLLTLLSIMERLRDPDGGCPWDVEQNFRTIAPYTIEEAYEVSDAIDRNDIPALRDELGDLLFQVVFHAQMASELDAFDFDAVTQGVVDKMVRRHPHVFGDADIRTADDQEQAWEDMKAQERKSGETGALAGVALGLPALMRAQKIQKRAAKTGFDWPDANGPRAKIDEELAEIDAADTIEHRQEEIGDLLFSVVNYARHSGIDAEHALRDATAKFEKRFARMERDLGDPIGRRPIDELEALWQAAKRDESADTP